MPLVEDPVHFSKSRLKSDLIAHNVALPPAASRKEVYVQLHLNHIHQRNAADFSSDEEDQVGDVADEPEDPVDAKMPDPSSMTDDNLMATLLKHGVQAGPIVASTRALYEKKLRNLLQSNGHERLNGAEKAVLYSDSEEEEDDDEEESGEEEDEKSSSEPETQETIEKLEQIQQKSKKVPSGTKSVISNECASSSPQAFSIIQMVEEMESRSSLSSSTDAEKVLNGSKVQEHWSQSDRRGKLSVDKYKVKNQSVYYTPKASLRKLGMKDPVKDILKDMFPGTETTPTGIYAACRRPIKGAAKRPVQYDYPDTPVSPSTMERREVERYLVPIQIQILVFLIVACILYMIYVTIEDTSPVLAFLDGLSHRLLLQAETQDGQVISGQD
ncbi:LEM domain-containing protein 1 isoform X3 [Mugil cephalus]|uniref:LEM domain-containing protein 1 isoform X3 n=1 Tax=Mugil cephalus TaxID=48193 RepID=UPI001FB67630|nr:LEM domain-containing protein 1 isoform X3 [Mugil cephalus]